MNDRELIINGKAVCSPEQQVYKNMKDIEALQKIIKTTYKTSSELTSSSASDLTANTNVGTAKEGWLMTEDGLLFRIDGNDGTTLLLTYYADLKGPQGETGSSGDPTLLIDDVHTSNNKTWSSNKIESEIADVIDDSSATPLIDATYSQSKIWSILSKGCYYATSAPTLISGNNYTFNLSNILNIYGNAEIKAKDLIFYIDSGSVDSVYVVNSILVTTINVTKIGSIGGGGSQLYQHNIKFYNSTKNVRASLSIINNSSVAFDKASLQQYIIDNYEDYNHPFTDIRGTFIDGGTNYIINYCHKATSSSINIFGSMSTSIQDISFDLTANSVSSFVDYVKAL